jgi:hypothetical protein
MRDCPAAKQSCQPETVETLPRITLGLMLLRSGPQDLPARKEALVAAALSLVAVTAVAQFALDAALLPALMSALVSILMLAAFASLVLRFAGRSARFQQTFMALLLTAAAIGVLEIGPTAALKPHLLEVIKLAGPNPDAEALRNALSQIKPPAMPVLMLSALFVWRVIVMAHIFRHALEIRFANALGVALLFPAAMMFLVLLSSPR